MLFVEYSVRISNELGATRPKAAKFSILVVLAFSALIGLGFFFIVLAFKDVYGLPFTNSPQVVRAVSNLAVYLASPLHLNSIQPVLTEKERFLFLAGVAVGAGWQWLVAYINVGCFYMVGLPLGFFLGSYLNLGAKGIWSGMITGVVLQTLILSAITLSTDWRKEAMAADSRIKKWRGSVDRSSLVQ